MTSTPGASLFWPEDQWRALQRLRLVAHLRHAAASPLYLSHHLTSSLHALESDAALSLNDILPHLPLTTKDHLASAGRDAYAVPLDQVVEWVCTSGTLGKPLDIPLTRRDLARIAENEAVALNIAGINVARASSPPPSASNDIVLLAVGMERLFVAGLAYWLGAQQLGATCIRIGPQLASHAGGHMLKDLISRFASPHQHAFVISVPSFLLNCEPPTHPLAAIIAIGEPIGSPYGITYNALGQRLHERFHCPILSTYATTETCTSFASGPTCTGGGGHLNPNLALLEILTEDGAPAPPDTPGELVVTPLGVEAMPLLRFRTGDIAQLITAPCPCGRTTPRIGPILGRRQQLIKFRGTNIYPNAIIDLLRATPLIADCMLLAEEDHALSDRLTIYIESAETLSDSAHLRLRTDLETRLRGLLRVVPPLHLEPPNSPLLRTFQSEAAATSRKQTRFLDRRKRLSR